MWAQSIREIAAEAIESVPRVRRVRNRMEWRISVRLQQWETRTESRQWTLLTALETSGFEIRRADELGITVGICGETPSLMLLRSLPVRYQEGQ